MTQSKLTYADYLQIDDLLAQQRPLTKAHDEMLFIVIHQVSELWLKLLLHELRKVRADFLSGELFGAIAGFKRARMTMKVLVSQFDVLDTLTPQGFGEFREELGSASGFQSRQFRELEFLLGYKRREVLEHHSPDSEDWTVLEKRLREMSLIDAFHDFLEHHEVYLPAALRDTDISAATMANPEVQQALVQVSRREPSMGILFELMLDFDQGLQEWRYRHVKLVERVIGHKGGTGGSDGASFLRDSLFSPVFIDLWEIRDRL